VRGAHPTRLIRRDANLLAKAKAVFGDDLVTDAFVCTCGLKGVSDPEESMRLSEDMHAPPDIDSREISYDGQHIRLIFCNGRAVDFMNSEQGIIGIPYGESYEA
jgi:hypothetical protein